MAREILFRGKRTGNGEWYYGSYLYLNVPARDWTGKARGNPESVHYIIDEKDVNYAVNPKTVGQFTGLTDKNGKRIFEGDIIKIPEDYDEFGINAGEVYEVYFAFGGFRLKPKRSNAKGFWLEDDKTVEIIGNIHDNPELLNGMES